MCISIIDSLWQFLLLYGILSAIGLGGTSVPLFSALMSKWFEKNRGLVISLAISGYCIGQFVLVPLLTTSVSGYGWRASHFWIGLIILVVNITLALVVIKGDPDDLGQKPFGQKGEVKGNQKNKDSSSDMNPPDMGLKDAMGTWSFWLFLIAMSICGSGDFLVSIHLIPLVTDHNISPATAGNMLAWFGLMSLAGILVAGPASDLIGNKIPIAITFVLRIFLFLLILKVQTLLSFYIFSLGFGFTFLITAPLIPTLMGKLYGFANVGLLTGFISTVHHSAGGLWAYVGGLIFDHTGSYQLAFILSAIMALAALFCSLFIKESA